MTNKPELLSPVGDQNSLYAAVQNGCDAIYLGGQAFNARNRAQNFDLVELKSAFDYAHIRGVKVYVTVNTLHKNKEIKDVLQFVGEIYQAGADGVIVQDLGTARLIRAYFPDLELHASTQLTIHNLAGAKYLEELGFSRVVLARELSLSEIKEIINNTNLKVETFIHGALCICYSGQCLMSSLIGGRSGNRGRCAQPCRLPYSLVDLKTEEVINEELAQQHLLSPKDINTLEILPELITAGIASFKIEGRMKRPEYAALTTRVYRKYIDKYFQEDSYQVKAEDQESLAQIFNRGEFIPGYYKGQEDLALISHQRPNNWGVKVGKVISYNSATNHCQIKLDKTVKPGDGIEIWTDKGQNYSKVVSKNSAGDLLEVEVRGTVRSGNPVYRTAQESLLDELAKSFVQPDTIKKIETYGHLTAKIGEKMNFILWDKDGFQVSSTVDFIPEEAKNQPLTTADFREQLTKLGNTSYQLTNLELDIADNLFIPISKLNEVRRKAVNKLNDKRAQQFITSPRTNKLQNKIFNLESNHQKSEKQVTVYLQQEDYIEDLLKLEVDRIYCDSQIKITRLKNVTKQAQETEIFIRLPRIAKEQELEKIKQKITRLEKTEIDGFLVPQLGVAKLVKDSTKKLVADFPLNIFNSYSTKLWAKEDYQGVVLSPELTRKEISELTKYNQIEKEIIVYGHLPMMISEYCPVGFVTGDLGPKESKKCNVDCLAKGYGLLDRKNMIAPIKTEPQSCRSIIYNSQPLYLMKYLEEIKETNCHSYRLDFTVESREEVLEITKAYQSRIQGRKLGPDKIKKLNQKMQQKGYTTGHFYRGVK
ncbi:collagenase-like protease [Halobacteroides halobius DSM 5150]|uniref:Collagenase-like protease n=1 Tax=Halobacteroides halobius (strain ATCC 35273 / DSM 5150 / MD-1) TaxID=748449 RepID=L0K8G6_HALHC|nr:U32 family peptidase [Halobacteroides halobius]AGB41286.1 collagenase-like protease [Halobacteroides halobius DSM 5150]